MWTSERTAVIVGATGAIGRATARTLADSGVRVALWGRDAGRLRVLTTEIGMGSGDCFALPCDVTNRESVGQAVEKMLAHYGRIDILVCAAGINITDRSLRKLDPADWDRLLSVNLTGAFNAVHAVLPVMREQGDGLIILLSSVSGMRPSSISGAGYSAAKAGLAALGTVIGREERGRNIRVTVIHPGEVDTPFLNSRSDRPGGVSESRREMILKPEDIASAVKYVVDQPARVRIPELVIVPSVDDYV